jgi:hypothetical protein
MNAYTARTGAAAQRGAIALRLLAVLVLTVSLAGVQPVKADYLASCTGCTITTSGSNVIYTFTASGTFTPSQPLSADILVVAGGGGGGGKSTTSGNYGGGGGAGGLVYQSGVSLTTTAYAVTVGAGGSAGTSGVKGGNGSNSSFGTVTATGGGGGGTGASSLQAGSNGGSGGGGGRGGAAAGAAGTGTSGQGNDGAAAQNSTPIRGGGGGGAGAAGSSQNGGSGVANSITGTAVTYAGGGGAGGATAGTGGSGGGGAGASAGAGTAGAANTGGGGGGAGSTNTTAYNGGAGGSGIVIVSYSTAPTIATSGTLIAFSAPAGVPSAEQSYSVFGANLTDPIVITPPTDFELSVTSGSGFSSGPISLTPTGGTVSSTTIYVRFNRATAGASSGSITHTSTGATQKDVAVSGTALIYYALTVNAGANGGVTLNPPGGSYASGTVVTLTPAPNSGYFFGSWSGDLSGNANPATITMDGNKSVTANFVAGTCSSVSVVASADTYMSGYNDDYNYGGVNLFKVTNNSSGTQRGALLQFDLSAIASNAIVSSASLKLYVSTASTQAYSLYNMRRAWVEGTLTTGASSTTSATWLTYDGVNTWGTAGAASITLDRYDANLWGAATNTFTPTGSKTVAFNSNGVAVVQGWISGSLNNYGLTMQSYSSTSGSDDLQISSSENTTPANRPTLNVTYCVVAGPTITTSGTLTAFSTPPGTPSTAQTYTVAGSNLTADISISAPAGFQLSTDDVTYGPSLTLAQTGGSVAATTVYVRLFSATEGSLSGDITHTSTGATQKKVAVSGEATWITTLILQDGLNSYTGTRDTYIYNTGPTTVRGAETTFVQDYDSATVERRSLLRFDLSSIPAGATITAAEFAFYVTAEGQGFNMYRMLVPWDEATVTYASIGNRHFAADGVDAETAVAASWTGHDGLTGFSSVSIPPATVQDWISGALTNNGWLMIATDNPGGDGQQLASREETTQANRPKLTITYSLSPNHAPDAPALVQPLDDATGVSTTPTLEVTVSDPDDDAMSVSFYGRPVSPPAPDFSIIVFPDTQKYANTTLTGNYATFYAMTQWIVDQKTARNIVFVTHVGDIVEDNIVGGWVVADTAFDTLDTGGVAYSVGLGNNDIAPGSDYTNFENYFGVARFTGKPTYGGHYGSNNANNYSLFSASGMDFIVINMNNDPSAAELAWADGLLTTYSDRRAIVESHNQLSLTDGWSNSAVYDALKGHANLFLMLSGHLSGATDGAAKRTDVYNAHTIYSTLQDYQSYTNVNNGYLRIYRFSPADDKIYMTTYSPTQAAYETADPDDTLEFTYDMPGSAAWELIGTVNGVASGAHASVTWPSRADNTEYEWYAAASDGSKSTDSATWSFTTAPAANQAPVLDTIGPQSVNELAALTFTATATDADIPANTLSFSLSGEPTGAGITTGGAFTWTPTEAQGAGSYTFDVCVSDGALNDCETITVTVNEVNVAPVLNPIGNKSVNELAALTFTATATDADLPANTLTFSLSGSVPAGAGITSGGAFTWTPTEAQGAGSYTFDVCVSDGALNDCETITVTVNEVNVAPVLDAIGDKNVNELAALTFTATATDADLPANTLSFSLSGSVPAGAGITTGGAFTWTPTEAQGPGSYPFDVCVSDGALNDCETITVTVAEVNVAPVLDAIGTQSVEELSTLTFNATAVDTDIPANTLNYSLADGTSGSVPAGAGITTGGAFTWTPAADQGPADYTFDVCVSDGTASDCETITVHVTQGIPPVLPSNFHGEIHFETNDGGPNAGDPIDAYVDAGTAPIVSAVIGTNAGNLTYAINVPAYPDGTEPSSVTFKIGGRIVATANWVSGTDVTLNIHPPKANTGGGYAVLLADAPKTLSGSATDWGTDASAYAWDLDDDGAYDDAAGQTPSSGFAAIGSYPIKLKVTDSQHGEGFASSHVFVITLGGLAGQVYNGNPHPVTVAGVASPFTVEVLYGDPGVATPPTDAETYKVLVNIKSGADVVASLESQLAIGKATATVTLGGLSQTYDGTAKHATATTNPPSLNVTFTYNGSATEPVTAGSYAAVATVVDNNYAGTATGTLVIGKATAAVTLGGLSQTYDGTAKHATATTNPPSLNVTFTYDGSATAPTNAGSYAVVATVADANYTGSASGTLVIGKATATVTLGGLSQTYDGTAKHATATTNPSGLTVTFTYDGSATEPVIAGSYVVVATVNDANYMGSATDTLVITAPKHSINLAVGWNLVSFNLKPLDTSPAVVLASVAGNYDLVYAWDATGGHAGSGNWMKYDPTAPSIANSLTTLDDRQGFWIHMTAADTLEVSGTFAASTDISLKKYVGGWNLVGYPSDNNGALPAALRDHGLNDKYTLVIAYHANDAVDPWKLFDPIAPVWANDLNPIQPGWGYWIYVTDDATWTVDY